MTESPPAPSSPNCYCSLWQTSPELLRSQGVPEGFCGLCEVRVKGRRCGRPGHTQAHPSAPVTAAWCEAHQPKAGLNPLQIGCMVLAAALALLTLWAALRPLL